eukprot:scaffold6558_cov136-Isochrysis_galbana.AAC.2
MCSGTYAVHARGSASPPLSQLPARGRRLGSSRPRSAGVWKALVYSFGERIQCGDPRGHRRRTVGSASRARTGPSPPVGHRAGWARPLGSACPGPAAAAVAQASLPQQGSGLGLGLGRPSEPAHIAAQHRRIGQHAARKQHPTPTPWHRRAGTAHNSGREPLARGWIGWGSLPRSPSHAACRSPYTQLRPRLTPASQPSLTELLRWG